MAKMRCRTRQFWKIADEENMEGQPPFEYVSSRTSGENVHLVHYKYATPFLDREEGDGFFINSRSILRMRIESVEMP